MKTYIGQGWAPILSFNQLDTFEQLWNLQADWFEPPNYRRGGWSGASRYAMKLPDGDMRYVFIKRQENHRQKTWRHPITGEPSFAVEMRNILRLLRIHVPTLTPVYYAQRLQAGRAQAILITEELTGFQPLTTLLQQWGKQHWPRPESRLLIKKIADALALMHQHRLQHHGLYTKHIFVKITQGHPEVCLIDLEKMRLNWFSRLAMRRDLYTLYKDFGPVRLADQMRFLLDYLKLDRLNRRAKRIWREIHNKTEQKHQYRFSIKK